MRIALTAWGINPCGYINIAYMPKSASGTTSTHAKELLQECHAATHILILVTRLWEWGDGLSLSMARANCTSIALMHALNRYNIYIYTHLSPQCICFSLSIYFFIHDLDFHISCCYAGYDPSVWPRPSAAAATAQAPPGVPLDHLPLQRRLAAIMEVLEVSRIDLAGNHIDIPSYKIHHPSFRYTMVYLANGWFRGFIDGDTWWYMNLTVNI